MCKESIVFTGKTEQHDADLIPGFAENLQSRDGAVVENPAEDLSAENGKKHYK